MVNRVNIFFLIEHMFIAICCAELQVICQQCKSILTNFVEPFKNPDSFGPISKMLFWSSNAKQGLIVKLILLTMYTSSQRICFGTLTTS